MVNLKKLYEDLHALQVRAFGDKWQHDDDGNLTEASLDEALQKYTMLIIMEAAELMNETNYKSHKPKKQLDMPAIQKEVVDIFIYAMDAATVLFPSYEAFLLAVKEKKEYNESRSDWSINSQSDRPIK